MERTQSFLLLSLWLHCHVTTRTGTPQPLLSEHLCVRLCAQSYTGALCGSVLSPMQMLYVALCSW